MRLSVELLPDAPTVEVLAAIKAADASAIDTVYCVVTPSGVGVASATVLLTLVVAPFGFFDPFSLGDVILDIAIVVLVMRWQPRRVSGTRTVSPGNSAVDGGRRLLAKAAQISTSPS